MTAKPVASSQAEEDLVPVPPSTAYNCRPRCRVAGPGRRLRSPANTSGRSGGAVVSGVGDAADGAAGPRRQVRPKEEASDRTSEPSAEEVELADLEIQELVGSGITADVYRGKWKSRVVAVKQLETTRRARSVKEDVSFTRELAIMTRISACVDHQNLVKLYGVSLSKRPYRIITEFCEGGTCFELLHNRYDVKLTWCQRHRMCCDVVCGMEYLHDFNPEIIHRDLKSLNLLLARSINDSSEVPLVKVADFGFARVCEQGSQDLKMTKEVGTGHWMAPEVLTGYYDRKVDIYSFAMVLFEIICREVPWEELSPGQVPSLAFRGERPDLKAVPADCPDELIDLMRACWSHDASDRPTFASIGKMLGDLKGKCAAI